MTDHARRRRRSRPEDDQFEPSRSPGAHLETNPVILVLAEIAVALALREREARGRLTVVRPDAE